MQHKIIYAPITFSMFPDININAVLHLQSTHEHARALWDSHIYLQFASDNHL